MENLIKILNRLVESKVSLEKAYYAVFGDYMEVGILMVIINSDASSRALKDKAIFWVDRL
jgi:hypothetical protein